MFAGKYNLLVGKAIYIADPLSEAWNIVRESNQLVDSVLSIESLLNKQFKASQKNSFIERNNQLLWTYSDSYAKAYHHALNGMVERRMRKTILRVASYWYSAWLESGQPDFLAPPKSNLKISRIASLQTVKSLLAARNGCKQTAGNRPDYTQY